MTLDLLRHGEPEGGRLYRGNLLDNPLSEKGWQQMQASVNGIVRSWVICFNADNIRAWKSYKSSAPNG
jgi:broad specificity phosphatase PhoE